MDVPHSLYQADKRNEMGLSGREYALKHFDREKLLGELEARLVEIAGGNANWNANRITD